MKSTIELYIEPINSGVLVEGMINDEYVEIRYKYILNHPNELLGVFNVTGLTKTIARYYGVVKNYNIEGEQGQWKRKPRTRKITDDMYQLINEVEKFLKKNGFQIIE